MIINTNSVSELKNSAAFYKIHNSFYVYLNNYFIAPGFMLFSFWAWNVICAPDVFSWNFSFMLLNMGQLVYIIYQMRPVKFDPELEEVYQTLFQPFKVFIKYFISEQHVQILCILYIYVLMQTTMNLLRGLF